MELKRTSVGEHRRRDARDDRRDCGALRRRGRCGCRGRDGQDAAAAEATNRILFVALGNGDIKAAVAVEAHVPVVAADHVVSVAASLNRAFVRRRANGLLGGGFQRLGTDQRTAFGAAIGGFVVGERRAGHRAEDTDAVLGGRMRGEDAVGFARSSGQGIDDEHRGRGLTGKGERHVRLGNLFESGGESFRIAGELRAGGVREILAFARAGEIEELGHDRSEDGEQ